MGRNPAIFLDRDGVINRNPPNYVKRWEEFEFLPGALEALRLLAGLPWQIFIVTNQSAVGRGILPQIALDQIHAKMREEIQSAGGRIDGIYFCPHKPEDGCDCRKPRPGLLLQAAREHSIEFERSIMVGDSPSDLAAAEAVSMPAIQIRSLQAEGQYDSVCSNPANLSIISAASLFEIAETFSQGYVLSSGQMSPADLMVYFRDH